MKSYNTIEHDVPTTTPIGKQDFNTLIEESYAYNLWDQDKTLGCKCDPVYYGADCSLKKCKYGVDPLFYDSSDGVIYQTTVVHLGSKSVNQANIDGSFRLTFYDVFGEKYVTEKIPAARTSCTASLVQSAFENLPNDVIAKTSTDVTGNDPAAVSVSMQNSAGTVTTIGTIGAGTQGESGAGLGTEGNFGPEFTVTFNTNPGILKSIEVDTREINNLGSPEYWVANTRQGQFNSRYSHNLGRVNTLKYGSKILYTNTDLNSATKANANTLVKIGGQELRVTAATSYSVTLSEEYLGASIIPVLTDSGVYATALSGTTLTITAPTDTIIADTLQTGAKLYAGLTISRGCPMTSATGSVTTTTTSLTIAAHDCFDDIFDGNTVLYRRSDDPSNQNLYRTHTTNADTGAATAALLLTRGSATGYTITATADQVKAMTDGTGFTANANLATAIAQGARFFVNGRGPFTATAAAATGQTAIGVNVASKIREFFDADVAAGAVLMRVDHEAANANIAANDILQLAGRRYKVASISGTGQFQLTETFAGGQLLELCGTCVTDVTTTAITTNQKVRVVKGSKLVVGDKIHVDSQHLVETASSDVTSITVSQGENEGGGANAFTGGTKSLFSVQHGPGYVGTEVTEHASPTTFHYVSQCSNRGTCDSSTGICKCFKGYSNDNCDTQNMLAM